MWVFLFHFDLVAIPEDSKNHTGACVCVWGGGGDGGWGEGQRRVCTFMNWSVKVYLEHNQQHHTGVE